VGLIVDRAILSSLRGINKVITRATDTRRNEMGSNAARKRPVAAIIRTDLIFAQNNPPGIVKKT